MGVVDGGSGAKIDSAAASLASLSAGEARGCVFLFLVAGAGLGGSFTGIFLYDAGSGAAVDGGSRAKLDSAAPFLSSLPLFEPRV